jgi:hypothetical protein
MSDVKELLGVNYRKAIRKSIKSTEHWNSFFL